MIDKQTKTNFESFSKDYPDLGQLVKDARTKIVNFTKQLDDVNTAPQPVLRPGADLGVNSGDLKKDIINKQIFDTKADLDKQVDECTSYHPPEIKNDIKDKVNYLTNPENKELDKKESKESFDFMEKMHFRGKENRDKSNKEYKEGAVERSSDRFNALLVSFREEGNKPKEKEMDKSAQKDKVDGYPKSSDYYNQSLNYKIEPLDPQKSDQEKDGAKKDVPEPDIENSDIEPNKD